MRPDTSTCCSSIRVMRGRAWHRRCLPKHNACRRPRHIDVECAREHYRPALFRASRIPCRTGPAPHDWGCIVHQLSDGAPIAVGYRTWAGTPIPGRVPCHGTSGSEVLRMTVSNRIHRGNPLAENRKAHVIANRQGQEKTGTAHGKTHAIEHAPSQRHVPSQNSGARLRCYRSTKGTNIDRTER